MVLTDDEVAAAVRLAGPRDVVQLINYVTVRASFDRITEAAGLRLEPFRRGRRSPRHALARPCRRR